MPQSDSFQIVSPVDGRAYAERGFAAPSQIESALAAAREAQPALDAMAMAERQALCRELVRQLQADADAIGDELTWQIGRPRQFTGGEIAGVAERTDYLVEAAPQALESRRKDGGARAAELHFEPLGTLLVISPWNYPYLTAVNAVVPGLLAGNPILLKPSPLAPLAAERLASAALAAGFPRGALQVLHLRNADTAALIAERDIGRVVFTGSVEVGRLIGAEAGRQLKPVTLELGGSDAAYVRADADIEGAARGIAEGAFFNSGQSCCAVERVFVDTSVETRFVDAFAEAMREWRLGDPFGADCALGPMVNDAAAHRLRTRIDEARAAGARPLDAAADQANHPTAAYHPAAALLVDAGSRLMREEIFGPLAFIAPVEGDAEAVRAINDSDFGLTASIWTADTAAARRLGRDLDVGTVYLNACDYLDPFLAWSGRKNSGVGFSLSARAPLEMTRPKSYHLRPSG